MGRFDGRVVIVTGAARGIGFGTANRFAEEGASVAIIDLDEAAAAEAAGKLSLVDGAKSVGVGCDVSNPESVDAAVERVVSELGGLHVLVNNAGITRDNLAMRMKDEDWDAVIDTNLKAVFRLSRAVMRPMMKQRHGRIINITSVVGASGNPGQANYAAAKAGVAGMTRALARELGSRNVTVNCVAPGFIDTDMTKALTDEQHTALKAQIPLGRLGQPEDIAEAVAFLASPQAAYITGVELHVNGGMFMN